MKLDFSTRESNHFLEHAGFTDIEKDIFKLRDRGWTIANIALHMNYCEKTIGNHSKNIKKKILKCMKETPL